VDCGCCSRKTAADWNAEGILPVRRVAGPSSTYGYDIVLRCADCGGEYAAARFVTTLRGKDMSHSPHFCSGACKSRAMRRALTH
jgi:hypothetical protein